MIKSSHVQHPQLDVAMEILMMGCQDILHQGYDPKRLAARGHRIKKMGDGLLGSTEFPFANPDTRSHASTALALALESCKAFHGEMEKLGYPAELFCAVGTQGFIEGFLSKSGIKQHDVRGRAINFATR